MNFILCYILVGNESQGLTLLEVLGEWSYRKIKSTSGKEMKQSQNKKFIDVLEKRYLSPQKRLQEYFTVRVRSKRPLFIFLLFYNMHTRFTSSGTGTCLQPGQPWSLHLFFFVCLIARDLTKKKKNNQNMMFHRAKHSGFCGCLYKVCLRTWPSLCTPLPRLLSFRETSSGWWGRNY